MELSIIRDAETALKQRCGNIKIPMGAGGRRTAVMRDLFPARIQRRFGDPAAARVLQ
jgi:hypothetical protein